MKAMLVIMAGGLLCTSCVGSFGLFNKLAAWNKQATGNKFLNELIFILISPAYAVCSLADVLVLNTIEFWSGNNPMASNIGKTKQVKGQDGLIYAVTYLKDGYEVRNPKGEAFLFLYDKATDSWSMTANGEKKEMFRFNEDGTIKAVLPNGGKMDVSQNEGGLYEVRMAVANDTYLYAQR